MNTLPLYRKTIHRFSILMATIGLIIGLFLGTAGLALGFADPITPGQCTGSGGTIAALMGRVFQCQGGSYDGYQVVFPGGPNSGPGLSRTPY